MLGNSFKKKNSGEKSVSMNSNSGGGDHGDNIKKLAIVSGLYIIGKKILEVAENATDLLG